MHKYLWKCLVNKMKQIAVQLLKYLNEPISISKTGPPTIRCLPSVLNHGHHIFLWDIFREPWSLACFGKHSSNTFYVFGKMFAL